MNRIGILTAGLTLILLGAAPAPEEQGQTLPGSKIPCDTKVFEVPPSGLWKVIKAEYNEETRQCRWVLEAQKDIADEDIQAQNEAWNSFPTAVFFDADKVRIHKVQVQFEGNEERYKKGDRFRVILQLPDEELMKKVTAVEMRGK